MLTPSVETRQLQLFLLSSFPCLPIHGHQLGLARGPGATELSVPVVPACLLPLAIRMMSGVE